jgi:hypothetical protein
MPIVRVFYKPDKSVAVLYWAPKSKLSQENAFAKMAREVGLAGLEHEDIDSSELPSREYRNAWEKEKGKPFRLNQEKKDEIDNNRNKLTLEERIVALEAK